MIYSVVTVGNGKLLYIQSLLALSVLKTFISGLSFGGRRKTRVLSLGGTAVAVGVLPRPEERWRTHASVGFFLVLMLLVRLRSASQPSLWRLRVPDTSQPRKSRFRMGWKRAAGVRHPGFWNVLQGSGLPGDHFHP